MSGDKPDESYDADKQNASAQYVATANAQLNEYIKKQDAEEAKQASNNPDDRGFTFTPQGAQAHNPDDRGAAFTSQKNQDAQKREERENEAIYASSPTASVPTDAQAMATQQSYENLVKQMHQLQHPQQQPAAQQGGVTKMNPDGTPSTETLSKDELEEGIKSGRFVKLTPEETRAYEAKMHNGGHANDVAHEIQHAQIPDQPAASMPVFDWKTQVAKMEFSLNEAMDKVRNAEPDKQKVADVHMHPSAAAHTRADGRADKTFDVSKDDKGVVHVSVDGQEVNGKDALKEIVSHNKETAYHIHDQNGKNMSYAGMEAELLGNMSAPQFAKNNSAGQGKSGGRGA